MRTPEDSAGVGRAASALLADLCRQGVELKLTKDRLRIVAPVRALTPDIRAGLIEHKPELLGLIPMVEEYRTLLRRAMLLSSSRRGPSAEYCNRFLDEQARLVDDLGPSLASAVVLMTARLEQAQDQAPEA